MLNTCNGHYKNIIQSFNVLSFESSWKVGCVVYTHCIDFGVCVTVWPIISVILLCKTAPPKNWQTPTCKFPVTCFILLTQLFLNFSALDQQKNCWGDLRSHLLVEHTIKLISKSSYPQDSIDSWYIFFYLLPSPISYFF